MVASRSFLALALALPTIVTATQYILVKEYTGSRFFDDWSFYGHFDDLTNGDAIFVTASTAASEQLAFVNSAGNAIVKVDNKTVVPFNEKRNTVRITTKDRFAVGSVWIADMLHVPYGCSVWPAFWSEAPNWPIGGEIDTFEGVNMVHNSQSALHTEPGCTVVDAVQTSTLIVSTDCSFKANNNEGCATQIPDPKSYGAAFAASGGGVFVTEFAETGISIWFFSRSDVPGSLQGNTNSIDTSVLGRPVANYPSGHCNIDKFFDPQNLIFDITLCGDFAGNPQVFNETCSGTCYNDFVIGPPSNYDNAYFEVRSVRVFGTSSAVVNGASRNTENVLVLSGVVATLVLLMATAL